MRERSWIEGPVMEVLRCSVHRRVAYVDRRGTLEAVLFRY